MYFNPKAACIVYAQVKVKWLHDNDNESRCKMEYIFLKVSVPGNNVVVFPYHFHLLVIQSLFDYLASLG